MNRTFHMVVAHAGMIALASGAVAGCSGSTDSSLEQNGTTPYASLFDTPSGAATPDQLTGLWGGTTEVGNATADVRLRFGAGDLTAASRCKWSDGTVLTAGAKGKSRTTPKTEGICMPISSGKTSCGELETLESVSDKRTLGDKWCAVSFSPRAYEYRISGTKAQLVFGAETLDLVKISD